MDTHFQPMWGHWYYWIWSMVWQNQEVVSKPDYILDNKQQMFLNIVVRDPHHNSDHFMVLGCLLRYPLQENKIYLGSWWCFPLKLSVMAIGTRAYTLFRALRKVIPRPNPSTFPWTACISQDTWSHIDTRADRRRYPVRYQLRLCRLIHRIRDKP